MIQLQINGVPYEVDVPPDTPLLWVVRDHLGLTGTKFGCGMGLCGACTMHLGGVPVRTCLFPVSGAVGQEITTIEGLPPGHPVPAAWLEEQVPQCGYCQSGQIMAAVAFLNQNPTPTEADVKAGITNLCRCGTYERIRKAVVRASKATVAEVKP
ncbi:MAG: (2Fe-2S)-binding protein [Myxococcota bacterium]